MTEQYQVLARKYRPKDFSELLGQAHVSQALANAIDTGRLHHAYLFTGTRGVGKTTIARILAKCLNCETGITSTPCGVCDTCQSIDAGRFLDLIEIDAASRTKVEDTRDLLENVPYAPVQGRYKVYLIDEVHMLSTHSFNALLKTLEEPPEHVKFIFATTDPQKLPITIISRCLQFVLRPMPQALLAEHLAKVLSQESVAYSESALWQLASAAKGSVRDALSLTDQAIAFGGGAIQADTVNEMLGLVNSTDVLALIAAIYQDDKSAVSTQIALMREKMVDAASVFDELIDRIHQMALLQILPQTPLDMSEAEQTALLELSKLISGDVLQLYYEILIKSRDGIRLASTPMQALEMGILRLLAFRPLAVDEVIMPAASQQPSDDTTVITMTSKHHEYVADRSDNTAQDMTAQADLGEVKPQSDESSDIPHHSPLKPSEAMQATDTIDVTDHTLMRSMDDADNVSAESLSYTDNDAQDVDSSTDEQSLDEADVNTEAVNLHEELEQIEAEPSLSVLASEHVVAAEDMAQTDFTEAIDEGNHISDADLAADTKATDDAIKDSSAAPNSQVGTLMTQAQMIERLKPTPVELIGTWDASKWDYWLHQARVDGHFSPDELALMAGSMMHGEIKGLSQLYIAEQNSQVKSSFNSLLQKFTEHYPELNVAPEAIVSDQLDLVPRQLSEARQQQLRIDAQNQLINSPVFQKLWHEGYIIDDGTPVLTNAKLSID
ncbi:DNA polymerase III subunit gamma/tau [Moraxella sp. RCAD0137]|uniref:DNA polymerase III subunit gamma/tau n=1 Tax=Moraxella sp. RCAD0137 TaxID=1775913 RepID=UPI000C9F6419|nr:DNA polymerase III subunit gamma/tau [Moraxella sp. RCAD0137]PNP98862.1 DNA polymerase III subunit gamma/tau [Moraxella sp. RCAD0137]